MEELDTVAIEMFAKSEGYVFNNMNDYHNNKILQKDYEDYVNFKNSKSNDSNPYDDVLSLLTINRGVKPDAMKDVLQKIAWHETGGTLNPQQVQKGGSGVGLYQYEPKSFKTAKNRFKNFYRNVGEKLPQWFTDLSDKTVDKLTSDEQSALASVDMAMRKGFDIRKALESDTDLVNEWGSGWQTESDPVKMKKFTNDLKSYYEKFPVYEDIKPLLRTPLSFKFKDGGSINKLRVPLTL